MTASNQPQRRWRPVVAPNSAPRSTSRSPSGPRSSVGGGVDLGDGVGDVGLEAVGVSQVLLEDRVGIHRQAPVDLGQEQVLLPQGDVQLLGEDLAVEEILD